MIDQKKLLLVMDANLLGNTQVGIFANGKWLELEHSSKEPLQSLFFLVEKVLKDKGLKMKDIGGYVFCQGPGSLLGIRLTAMAIRTWKAIDKGDKKLIYGYSSMAALGKMVEGDKGKVDGYLARPIRQNGWAVAKVATPLEHSELSDEQMGELTSKVFGMRGAKAPLCPQYYEVAYNLQQLEGKDFLNILFEVEDGAVDAKVGQPQSFKKWDGERHR